MFVEHANMNSISQPAEPDRVRQHTAPEILERIERNIEASVRFHATQPQRVIDARIEELEQEWDIERWLETNASALALTTALLGLTVHRKWLLLTCGVTGFLLQHAISGWCPPLPILRRQGVRTRSEIDREKFALKILRGDFKDLPSIRRHPEEVPVQEVLEVVNS
jgi:hypothetical protein